MVRKNETVENMAAIKEIERATKSIQLARKLQSIRLVFEGYAVPEAARIAGCCEKTVYNNLNDYEEGGIEALYPKQRPGRSRKLTTEQEAELYETMKNKLPSQVGFFPFVNWTSSLAVQWVKERFGAEFSERGMRNLFDRIRLSYTRPTYTLKKADPQRQQAFIDEFEQVKKTDL